MTTARWRRATGLRTKLLASFSALVSVIGMLVVVYFPARLEHQASRAMAQKLDAIQAMTAYSIAAGLVFADTIGVRDVLAGTAQDADVFAVEVRDAAGAVFAREVSRHSADGALPLAVVSGPVVHAGERIGTIELTYSRQALNAEVAAARRAGILFGAGLVGAGLILVYAISTFVTRSLRAVVATVDRIADGDLSQRAVAPGDTDIDRLVGAFNRMVDRLAGAQEQLSASNVELESRVEARTAALREVMAEERRNRAALATSEASARAYSETLQSFIDVAPQAIVALDREQRVTRWNRAAERLFGWTAAEVLGHPVPYIPPAERAKFQRLFTSVLNRTPMPTAEVTRLRKDGKAVSVLVSTGALTDKSDRVTGAIAIVTDLTERKSLEEQLLQSQKMEAIGRLAGGVAHDFNNLLTVISSYTEMLLDGDLTTEQHEDAEQVAAAATRAASLTRQLLTFSRRQVVKLSPVNVNDIVHDMGPMLRRLLRENVQFRMALCGELGIVVADASQIEQVVMNLVVNASDAMPEGGVLTIETTNVDLDAEYVAEHATAKPGPHVQLAVSDSGVGMTAETISRIFEPFFTTKDAGRGTGLGLATTYAVVTRLGGHIRVYSEVGHGTTFKLFFPAAPTPSTGPADTGRDTAATPGGREQLLVVEDDAFVRRVMCRTLRNLGYNVTEASSGEAGLEAIAGAVQPFDLVITDLMMPGMNGRAFADRLGALRPDTPVVFISGYTDDTVSQEGLIDETHTFLQKPFAGAQLARAVREMLDAATVTAG